MSDPHGTAEPSPSGRAAPTRAEIGDGAGDAATVLKTTAGGRDDETRPHEPGPRTDLEPVRRVSSPCPSETDLTVSYVVGRAGDDDGVIDTRAGEGFRPGGLLQDRYILERELGRGGMGLVYLGRDRRLDRPALLFPK